MNTITLSQAMEPVIYPSVKSQCYCCREKEYKDNTWSMDKCTTKIEQLLKLSDKEQREYWVKLNEWAQKQPDRDLAVACFSKLYILYQARVRRKHAAKDINCNPAVYAH